MSGEDRGREEEPLAARLRRHWPYQWPALTLLIGIAVSVALTLTAHGLYTSNEQRLLRLRVREAEQVVSSGLPSVQTPLASAAALADATNGNRKKFRAFISRYVGTGFNYPFVSVSLWRLRAIARGPKVVVGSPPEITRATAGVFLPPANMNRLSVIGMLQNASPRVGYALIGQGRWVAYGESSLPGRRYSPATPNSAFSDLDYAIYLGPSQNPANLLLTSVRHLPLPGRRATASVPFGNTYLTMVLAPRRPLGGSLPQRLPWIILATGLVLTLLAALLMLRLSRGRESARQLAETLEEIAAENRRLYGEQRDIAQTLQHSLLPEKLPSLEGAEVGARYQAGERGVEIGGDWYDVIALDDDRVLMVVGDVSGRGLRAATTMAELRHAIHAYAAENHSPAEILSKLSRLLSVSEEGKLATVMCALLTIPTHEVTLASAGHLPPLLIWPGGGRFLDGPVGPPIGMEAGASYSAETYSVPKDATLLAFTDGLVERRGESLDRGLARLREAATANHSTLPDLVEYLLSRMRGDPPLEDDTAIVGVRWQA